MGDAIMITARRGPQISASGEDAAGVDGRLLLLCRAGAQLCAVPLNHVIEVMRPLPIKPILGGPPYVRGLCIIRGTVVPVVDTGLLVANRATDCRRLITVRTGSRMIALAAEAVLGICAIGADKLSLLPPLLRDAATEMIAAIGTLDAELLFFLRTARIVPEDLFNRLVADGAQL